MTKAKSTRACTFHLNLFGILSIYLAGREGLLDGQKLLSVMKVICRQPLTIIASKTVEQNLE